MTQTNGKCPAYGNRQSTACIHRWLNTDHATWTQLTYDDAMSDWQCFCEEVALVVNIDTCFKEDSLCPDCKATRETCEDKRVYKRKLSDLSRSVICRTDPPRSPITLCISRDHAVLASRPGCLCRPSFALLSATAWSGS
jgi:hypothetical protein